MASTSAPIHGISTQTNGINGISSPLTPGTLSSSFSSSEIFEPNQEQVESVGDAGSASGYYNRHTEPSFQHHNEEIVNHLYHAGFQTGNYADTILHVHGNSYRLHAIILSRSPFLAHMMSTSPQHSGQRTIYVPLEHDPEVTQEGFAIALGYLYSSVSLGLICPENARPSLAAGCLLGGMDDFCQYAYEICRSSMSVDNISSWLEFLERIPSPSSNGGSSVPMGNTVFGLYAQRMRDDVFRFLVVTLPDILDIHNTQVSADCATKSSVEPTGRDVLLRIFSGVPFEMFKAAVESPTFQIGSDQTRFKFAKDAIELRRRGISRNAGSEETVVLAFGASSPGASAVHVTRKMRKRPLWKVNQ